MNAPTDDSKLSDSRRQLVAILLYTLKTLRGIRSKKEVIDYIEANRLFEVNLEDKMPYESQSSKEPRWKTLIAWARKDCVEKKFVSNESRNAWAIEKQGINFFALMRKECSENIEIVRRSFLWSPTFKKIMNSEWVHSDHDRTRPKTFYTDMLPVWQKSPRGSRESREIERIIRDYSIDPAVIEKAVRDQQNNA